jgi:hypothetical protein
MIKYVKSAFEMLKGVILLYLINNNFLFNICSFSLYSSLISYTLRNISSYSGLPNIFASDNAFFSICVLSPQLREDTQNAYFTPLVI